MTIKQIYVFPRGDAWHAEMIGVGADEVFDTEPGAFGPVLPTPFLATMPIEQVLAGIEARNPGVTVDWFATEAKWVAGAI